MAAEGLATLYIMAGFCLCRMHFLVGFAIGTIWMTLSCECHTILSRGCLGAAGFLGSDSWRALPRGGFAALLKMADFAAFALKRERWEEQFWIAALSTQSERVIR